MSQAAVDAATPKRSREHWLVLALSAVAPMGLLLMRAVLKPSPLGHGTHEQLGLPPCQMMARFGIPCPGCGVTTAVTHAARGDLWRSFVTQPFGFALAIAAMLALPLALGIHFSGRDLYATLGRWNRRPVWIAILALVVAAWIYKLVVTLAS
jgi:hypothetical protein